MTHTYTPQPDMTNEPDDEVMSDVLLSTEMGSVQASHQALGQPVSEADIDFTDQVDILAYGTSSLTPFCSAIRRDTLHP